MCHHAQLSIEFLILSYAYINLLMVESFHICSEYACMCICQHICAEFREPFLGSVLAFCLIEGILSWLCCPVYPWLTGLWASCLYFPSHHRNVGITSGINLILGSNSDLFSELPDLSSLLCSIFFFFCILFHISICLMFVAIFS